MRVGASVLEKRQVSGNFAMTASNDNKGGTRISVIMPVHNSGRSNLEVSIRSVLAQTLKELELICVDDASTDCSPGVLREFEALDQRVRVVTFKQNKGTHEARKAAVMEATGDYIIPLDPDDWLDADACRRMCEVMDGETWIMAQFGMELSYVDTDVDSRRKAALECWFAPSERSEMTCETYAREMFVGRLHSWTLIGKIYRRASLAAAFQAMPDGYCVSYEDGATLLAFFKANHGKMGMVPDRLYNYRWGQGISTSTCFSVSRVDNMIRSGVFVNQFLKTLKTPCASAYARVYAQNTVSDIVYRVHPDVFRRKCIEMFVDGMSKRCIAQAFEDLKISHTFFKRIWLVVKFVFARDFGRRRRLRRRLALVHRIVVLRKTACRGCRSKGN